MCSALLARGGGAGVGLPRARVSAGVWGGFPPARAAPWDFLEKRTKRCHAERELLGAGKWDHWISLVYSTFS